MIIKKLVAASNHLILHDMRIRDRTKSSTNYSKTQTSLIIKCSGGDSGERVEVSDLEWSLEGGEGVWRRGGVKCH